MQQPTSIDTLLQSRNEYVARAASKLVDGVPLTGNESRRLGRLLGSERRDHFAGIAIPGLRIGAQFDMGAGEATPARAPRRIEDVENLEPKLRRQAEPGAASGYTEGAAVEVVGADGKLVKVVRHSTAGTPSAYPTVLRSVNTGVTVTLDADGILVLNSNYEIRLKPSAGLVEFRQNAGPYVVQFDLASLARHVILRTDDYCDGGVDKHQDHLASVPH